MAEYQITMTKAEHQAVRRGPRPALARTHTHHTQAHWGRPFGRWSSMADEGFTFSACGNVGGYLPFPHLL